MGSWLNKLSLKSREVRHIKALAMEEPKLWIRKPGSCRLMRYGRERAVDERGADEGAREFRWSLASLTASISSASKSLNSPMIRNLVRLDDSGHSRTGSGEDLVTMMLKFFSKGSPTILENE